MTNEEIIKSAANKLMGWKLPQDFYPDCGISFDREKASSLGAGSWPTGTNLLHVGQAREMFEFCLAESLDKQVEQVGFDQIRKQKIELEQRLQAMISKEVQAFYSATGVCPEHINVESVDITGVSSPHKNYLIERVKVILPRI